MIKRIQSVFLAFIIILHISSFFIPFWGNIYTRTNDTILLNGNGLTCTGSLCPVLDEFNTSPNALQVSNIMIIVISAIAILMYNNRMMQQKLVRFLLLSGIVQLAIMIMLAERISSALSGTNFTGNYSLGIAIPVITVILSLLAMWRIRKDENLVRSADRLR